MNTIEFEEISQRLDGIEQSLNLFNRQHQFIDLDELCKILGIAKRTYYQTPEKFKFNKFRFGRKLRFDRVEVITWMNASIRGNNTSKAVANV